MDNIPRRLKNYLKAEIDPAFSLRARLIFEEILKNKPKKILDAGCGRGFYSHALSFLPFIKEISAVDINTNYLKIAKKNTKDKKVKFYKSSIYSLPFPDNYFDCIIFSEVLEHLSDEKKALKELKRVLKKNGIMLITVPDENFPFLWDPINWVLMRFFNTHISKDIWWLAGIWADHQRLYTKEKLKKVLQTNGFYLPEKPKDLIHWSWPFSHLFLYGVGKNLVERFPTGQYFNRFNFKQKKFLSKILAFIFRLPSVFFDQLFPLNSSVNLFVKAVKT